MVSVLVAFTSTLVTIRLQLTQGMSKKQFFYLGMVCLGFFECPFFFCQFLMLPFGLKNGNINAPSILFRLVNSVFYDMIDKFILM